MKTIAAHSTSRTLAFATFAWALPSIAFAHEGHSAAAGFTHGAMHPLSGLDHLVVMVATGALAALIGGRARWGVPLAFLAMMLLGAASTAFVQVAFLELGILASLLTVACMLIARLRPPSPISVALIGAFGLLHGYAHGAEMPSSANGVLYALGFTLTSATLLGLGGAGVLLAGARRTDAIQRRGAEQ